jgi:integral membrane protein
MILIKFVIIIKIKMVKIFKTVAILEGISYLALFTNMLIVKPNNFELYHQLLYPIGMSHGLLFIGYILLALIIKKSQNWNLINLGIVLLASLLPFATFYIERKYIKYD